MELSQIRTVAQGCRHDLRLFRTSRSVRMTAAMLAICAAPALSQQARRPNFVFILADDLGYQEVGAFGQREIRTPNLDRMAREGMRLTRFYTGSPLCAPARSTLMTGLHAGHTRVEDNDRDYLRPEDLTVAEVLRHAGYTNGVFGKWGLSFNTQPESFPTRQGFDRFFGYLDQRHAHNFYPRFLISDEDTVWLRNEVPNEGPHGQGDATREVEWSHDRIVDESLRFIRGNRDRPSFAYLAFTVPHINNEGAKGPDGGFEIPELGIYRDKPWPLQVKSYAATITRLDSDVGRVLALLKELGIDENTLVIFSSDNGPTFLRSATYGGTDVIGEWFDGNGSMRGLKADVYEGGIRVPTIARWPGRVAPGTSSELPGYFPDVMPTLAELAGVSAPRNLDGVSVAPTLLGRPELQRAREHLFWALPSRKTRAVRAGQWKAVWTGEDGALFDLLDDPAESRDVKDARPEVFRRLSQVARANTGVETVIADWEPRLLSPLAGNR